MAQSLETLRSRTVTSIHGRRLALDSGGYVVGPPDIKGVVEDLTTSTGTDVLAYGIGRVTATGSSQGPVQYNLAAPVPGVSKRLCMNTTSTGSYQFLSTPNGASIMCGSDGTTKSLVNLVGPGGAVTLWGVTTAIWQVMGEGGYNTTALGKNVTYTTST